VRNESLNDKRADSLQWTVIKASIWAPACALLVRQAGLALWAEINTVPAVVEEVGATVEAQPAD